jgi:biopolymer transport protein ExbD
MSVQFAKRRGKRPEVNITPLIDVVFLLLVFFLLTSNAALYSLGLEAPAERADAPTLGDLLASVVAIGPDGRIELDGAPIAIGSLAAAASYKLAASAANRPFVVRPHPDVDVQPLVDVLDELRKAGVGNLQVSEPEAEVGRR